MVEKIKAASTQQHIPIKEIKDGVIILKNAGLRSVLMCTSINFALKSIDEQDSIIYKYQGFLNSLDFPIQIMVASRKFNIDPYIDKLRLREKEQANELLRIQTTEYIEFIKGLTELTNIMTESFYIIVPLNAAPMKKLGSLESLWTSSKEKEEEEISDFEVLKAQLWQRIEFVASALSGCGLRTVPLSTAELVELFYKLYNPSAKGSSEIDKARSLRIQ